jgi:hypothetical protein
MKVVYGTHSKADENLFEGRRLLSRAGRSGVRLSDFEWDWEGETHILGLEVDGVECQVSLDGAIYSTSTVKANILGERATLYVWTDHDGFLPRDVGKLIFADRAWPFHDTKELPRPYQKLGELLLKVLAAATEICLAAYETDRQAQAASLQAHRQELLAKVEQAIKP